ncbi:MAG: thiamine phosphate synthase, partial [Flavobacteriales bacterium]|nr:thiamine phosphate synthase [Flavobacteriales bacterium]
CHSFEEVEKLDGEKEYCFLSPVFDSISKQGYKAKFDKEELRQFLKKDRKIKVIGLGGVNEENYSELIEMGFDGGAFLGSVWRKYE